MSGKALDLWNELLTQNPTNEDLCYVIRWVESLRERAGQKLLTQNPTNEDLCYVIRWVESLRERAKILLKRSKEEILKEMLRL
jgi:hypothetical protein